MDNSQETTRRRVPKKRKIGELTTEAIIEKVQQGLDHVRENPNDNRVEMRKILRKYFALIKKGDNPKLNAEDMLKDVQPIFFQFEEMREPFIKHRDNILADLDRVAKEWWTEMEVDYEPTSSKKQRVDIKEDVRKESLPALKREAKEAVEWEEVIRGHKDWLVEVNAVTEFAGNGAKKAMPKYTKHQRQVAMEIILRVVDENHPIRKIHTIARSPKLEYSRSVPETGIGCMAEVCDAYQKGNVLKLSKVCAAVRAWLLPDRRAVMAAMRLHYVLKHTNHDDEQSYLQECINSFDRLFTHIVCQATQKKKFVGGTVIRMGGADDTDDMNFLPLNSGPDDEDELLAINKPIWDAMEPVDAVVEVSES